MEYRDACRLCLCEEEVAVNIFEYGEDELSHCQTIEEIFNIKVKFTHFPIILLSP